MAKTQENSTGTKKISTMIKILLILFFASIIFSLFLSAGEQEVVTDYNTAVISIDGPIVVDSSNGLFSDSQASSTDIVKIIEKASSDPNIKAILFEINSPGGSPVATDEIASKIKSISQNITTVSWIRETGASGAYWIASSTDFIVANRMSIVGSIGVYGSYLEWYGLMNRYNVTYKRLVSGNFKDTGVPFRPLTNSEDEYLQIKLDKLHQFFINEVADNRHMPVDKVKMLADGSIYLGIEAKDNGLIDQIGGKTEAIKYIEQKLNASVKIKEFSRQKSLLESITQLMNRNSFYIGNGIGSALVKDSGFKITT